MHLFNLLGFSVESVSGLLSMTTFLSTVKLSNFKGEFSEEKILFLTLSLSITDKIYA